MPHPNLLHKLKASFVKSMCDKDLCNEFYTGSMFSICILASFYTERKIKVLYKNTFLWGILICSGHVGSTMIWKTNTSVKKMCIKTYFLRIYKNLQLVIKDKGYWITIFFKVSSSVWLVLYFIFMKSDSGETNISRNATKCLVNISNTNKPFVLLYLQSKLVVKELKKLKKNKHKF